MSRRLVNLTLETLADLPHPCRDCVFWELDPAVARAARATGDPALEKEAWVSRALLDWGCCGKLIYDGGAPAGYVMYAPPGYLPRGATFPTSPASPDAALLTTVRVLPGFGNGGLGRMLVQAAAGDLGNRGVPAIEAFGEATPGGRAGSRCVVPAEFLVAVGFTPIRRHPRYPRLRLELRTARSWKSDVEYALATAPGVLPPERLPAPAGPAPDPVGGAGASHPAGAGHPAGGGGAASAARVARSSRTSIEPVATSDSTG